MSRINIPANPGELIGLGVAIAKKHEALGKSSPLSILKWDDLGPNVAQAHEIDTKINALSRELEILTEQRKMLIETKDGVADFARKARDVLSGVYRNEMKKLSDFGFEVIDSPKAKKANGTETNGDANGQ